MARLGHIARPYLYKIVRFDSLFKFGEMKNYIMDKLLVFTLDFTSYVD